ncbi:DEAD/DEAH box helicase family protein, partial [Delftia tsuruhatensis]|uniref:DEAD/DEAH box helicase family protein n=1 Tax=Delftia tsuruhatensis TaxID=180282 RepID=UPI0039BCE449
MRAALPQLLPGQQEDVAKTERAFAAGPGMLLTNGTGTGKTFSGLGAVRRFVDAGKKNVLVVVPDDKIGSDWMRSGRTLDLNIHQLPDSTVAGQGVTLTTYANLGMNDALASRAWDLVVADEAHTLMSSQDATPTAALARLRAITMHPDGAHARYQMLHAADLQAAAELRQKADDAREAGKTDQAERLEARARAAFEKLQADLQAVRDDVAAARGDGRRTKLLALSATPFAYELNVDWANGYLFDYDDGRSDESREFRGYNEGGNREQFFMQHFGYRMRYNKLTQPEAGVDRGLMQRQFNTWLKRRGVLSSRLLDVKADYDRRFVLFESAIGNRIDEAFTWLADHRRDSTGHAKLEELVNKQVDYLTRRYLLEAIKATEAVPIVRAHMALGRKVVVFHDYIKGGGVNPFALDLGLVDAGDRAAVAGALAEFQGQFGDLERAQLHKLPSPLQVFRQEFPELLVVNGREKRRDNLAAYEAFNDDERGPSVMLVQSAKDKGWSGHDTTGKHQRVLINLGLPTSPTKSIQQEGRVYRTGQVSNAIMRYLNTGTSWERTAFASTIATRAATAENLALGELARSLQDAYVQAFEEADTYEPGHEGEGTGGKDMDRARNNVISEWDRARSLYFSQQKKTSATKAREGADYFATPEPLGLKMVEWGDVREGEDTAEPSAGHGAIARWLPTHSRRTMVEPSPVLRSRLALADVRDSDRIVAGSFEDLAAANKYDVIVMNPPFGTAGRTAVDHLAKAYSHLREGGRVVAIIPTGPAADKKLEAWLYERAEKADKNGELPYTKPELHRAADVLLPASTFSRAATGAMTRVVVLDKLAKGEQPARAHRQIDLTDASSVEELFERLEHLDLPARTKPRQAAQAAGPAPAGAQPATAPSTAAPQAQPAPAQLATGEPGSLSGQLQRDGRPLVTHTTKSGKPLQGVVVQGMDRDTAMLYDAYTFKKDGGYFIRAKHLAREGVGFRRGESAVAPAMTADLAQELMRIAGGNVPGAGRGAQQAPMARAQKVVDAVRKAWANAPRINVVFDLQDPRVPQEARDADQLQAAEGAEGVPKGFYFDGEVYLVASQLATPEEAARVLYHEALGHHGLRGAFGEKLDAVLDQIIVARPREVRAKLQEYGELDDLVGRRYAAEEVLAEMAETQPQLGFVRRAVAAIRAWLRTHVPA